MAEMTNPKVDALLAGAAPQHRTGDSVHPAWMRLIHYCKELGHGEIEKLKIQDGLPTAAEVTTRKIKFSP